MTEKLTKLVWDGITNTWTEIELTQEEIAQRDAVAESYAEQLASIKEAEEVKAAKKTTVLAAIAEATGLTAEDISEALA